MKKEPIKIAVIVAIVGTVMFMAGFMVGADKSVDYLYNETHPAEKIGYSDINVSYEACQDSKIHVEDLRENMIPVQEICLPSGVRIDIDSNYSFPLKKRPICMVEEDVIEITGGTVTIVTDDGRVITTKENRTYKLSELEVNFTRID